MNITAAAATTNDTDNNGGSNSFEHHMSGWTALVGGVNPLLLSIGVVGVTSLITLLGVFIMFCFRRLSKIVLTVFYGLSAGTMLATATHGLLDAALAHAVAVGWTAGMPWIPVAIGVSIGLVVLQVFTSLANWTIQRHRGATANGYAAQKDTGGDDDDNTELVEVEGDRDQEDPVATARHVDLSDPLRSEILGRKRQADRKLNGSATTMLREKLLQPESQSRQARRLRRATMLVIVTVLQQIPDGLMVGVAFGNVPGDSAPVAERNRAVRIALTAALASWLSALPEVIAVVVPLREIQTRRVTVLAITLLGMVLEMTTAAMGALLVGHIRSLLPYALGAAGGATLFTVVSELIGAAYENDYRVLANLCTMSSFLIMLVFINLFG